MSGDLRKSVFQWNNVQIYIKISSIHLTLSVYYNLISGVLILWLSLKIKESLFFSFFISFSKSRHIQDIPQQVLVWQTYIQKFTCAHLHSISIDTQNTIQIDYMRSMDSEKRIVQVTADYLQGQCQREGLLLL